MDQNPFWEATRSSTSKEIPTFYGIHGLIFAFAVAHQLPLSCARPIQPSLQFHFLKIRSNTVLTSTSRSNKWSLSFRFPPPKTCVHPPFFSIRTTCSARLFLDLIIWNIFCWGLQIMVLLFAIENIKLSTTRNSLQNTCDSVPRWTHQGHKLESVFIVVSGRNSAWFKNMDSNSYVYISRTIHGMWMIYIKFERGGPKFSNTTPECWNEDETHAAQQSPTQF